MNASEAYEKYKHMDGLLSTKEPVNFIDHIAHDLWSAVKHEHFGKTVVNDVKVGGKSIMKEKR